MTNEYKPTRREIIGEIWNGVKNPFSKENVSRVSKDVGSKVGRFSTGYGIGTGLVLSLPYAIPSYCKWLSEVESSEHIEKNAENAGLVGGMITGLVGDIGQIIGYGYAVKGDHPEFLLIPVATNVASGVYEIGKKIYANARERVLEKHKLEGLEATVETATPTQE